MKRRSVLAVAAALSGLAASQGWAQSGDPDRIGRQEALGHASAIENAWRSVEERIGETDAGDLWEDEWNGLSDPPVGDWWLQSWTDRGLTARYCSEVLAVYADRDELKGVGRDQRAVQVAPYTYGGGRTGLQLILRGGRLYEGSRGREGGSLPGCMPAAPATGDRVALVGGVDDPKLTPVGVRWRNEDRTRQCSEIGSDTGTFTERRRIPLQTTAVTNCPGSDPNCNDLIELAGSPPAWPADCSARETMLSATPPELAPGAACSDWVRWESNCQIVYAPADPPATIQPPSITWEPGPVHTWTSSCSCSCQPGQIVSGSCTRHWAQNTEWRVFVLRPGEPEIRTRYPARTNGQPRLVNTVSTCSCTTPPPPSCPPGQVGTPPNCTTPPPSTCPPGQVGTPPNCTPITPQTTSGTEACTAPWSGTATWTQQPGQSRVYDFSGCSQSGTGACPDGQTGTATWTQAYGQAQVWDYSGCTPVDPQATSGTEACPVPWSGTAAWTQQPGEARVYDYRGCSQSGTGACPDGQTGTATWTQAYGQAQVWDYSGCTTPPPQQQVQVGRCPDGWSGSATNTLTDNGWAPDFSGCWQTYEGPCPAGWTGNIVYTDFWPRGGAVPDDSACVPVSSGTASCPAGWQGTATFTNVGNGPVYDYSACWQEAPGGCNPPYEGTSLWRRSWGVTDWTLVSHTCERPCYCYLDGGEDGCLEWRGRGCSNNNNNNNNQGEGEGGPDGNTGEDNSQSNQGTHSEFGWGGEDSSSGHFGGEDSSSGNDDSGDDSGTEGFG